jgi:hypothetical protein
MLHAARLRCREGRFRALADHYGTPEQRGMVTAQREAVRRLEATKLSVAAAVAKNPMSVMRAAQQTAAGDMNELAEKARSHRPAKCRSDSDGHRDAGGMTRIVSSAHRYKRPPQKKTPVALNVPSIVATKKNRHPAEGAAAEAVSQSPHLHDGAAQPSTPRDAERDRAVTQDPELRAWLGRAAGKLLEPVHR